MLSYFKQIEEAMLPEDIFGKNPDLFMKNYRRLLKLVHPDVQPDKSEKAQEQAKLMFQKVQQFKILAEFRISCDIYGTDKKIKTEFKPVTIKTKRHLYTFTAEGETGDLCNLYTGHDQDDNLLYFKSIRDQVNEDMLENEIQVLTALKKKHHDDLYSAFHPDIVNWLNVRDDVDMRTKLLVLPDYIKEGYVTLKQVRAFHGDQLNPRHMVWIFKRLLMLAGHIHNHSIYHMAMLPEHILVHPVTHAIKVLDWSYAVTGSGKPKAYSPKYKNFYPDEVFDRGTISGVTDIYMIVKCMFYLMEGNNDAPLFMARFLDGCLKYRSYDAWGLHEEFDIAVKDFYGEPKYVELEMGN